MPTPASTPGVDEPPTAPAAAGAAARVPGSVRRQTSSSSVGTENDDRRRRPACAAVDEHVDVADDQRPARDQARTGSTRRGAPRGRRASAGSGPRPAGTGRSPRRSRRPRPPSDGRASSRRSTSATFTFTRIERAVAVVGRPVGAQLEGADVTERAAVRAAHVRVERPAERHPLTRFSALRQGSSRYSHAHHRQYRTYVRTRSRSLPGIVRVTSPDADEARPRPRAPFPWRPRAGTCSSTRRAGPRRDGLSTGRRCVPQLDRAGHRRS